LRQDRVGWRDAQFCEYGNARMIRTERWKLIRRFDGPNGRFPDEFYDLHTDPREEMNRIDDPSLAGVVADLSARLEAHYAALERPDRHGRDIAARPLCNPAQPWSLPARA